MRLKCRVVSSPLKPGVRMSLVYENGSAKGDRGAAQCTGLLPKCYYMSESPVSGEKKLNW